ncbi:Uncharacterised protein [uncultured archaeon]|nr:Uncharacterised protein [uncultured archaeon]
MRHFPIMLLGIVAIAAIITLLMSVSYVPVFTPLAVSIVPYGKVVSGGNTVIVQLDIGKYLGDQLNAVTETMLDGLRGGTIHGKGFSADYNQNINFWEPGTFNGCHVAFGRNEQNEVTDYLQCDDAIFKYTVDFSSGIESKIDGGRLPDIEDETIELLGNAFTIVDTSVNTGTKDISLRLFGGFGSIDLRDTNYGDDAYTDSGAKVNGASVHARVKIKATQSGDKLYIYSIQYLLDAYAAEGGLVQITPLHCVREFLQYPLGMISPSFDICYKGTSAAAVGGGGAGITGNEVRVKPSGNDEYVMVANNLLGNLYNIPLAQNPGMYGNKGRNFVFVEAPNPGAPNINVNDYVLLNSKKDIQGVSNVLMYKGVSAGVANFDDLTGARRSSTVDPATNEGQLMVGEGTYRFVVGAGGSIAMDQTNDGQINGAEAVFVLPGGSRIDFGPGFVVTITTPSRLFSEPMGDENTQFNIVFGGDINIVVPSPQVTVPGYDFKMVSESGDVSKGMTKYGILFSLQKDHSAELRMTVPGAQVRATKGGAQAEVYITLERQNLMKKTEVPAPAAKCGDGIVVPPEYCDPPGSLCADYFKRKGTCSADCSMCEFKAPTVCGNKLLEKGEECESSGDCPANFECKSCKCVALPAPVCGNKLLEKGEQCEADADCPIGYSCSKCNCVYSAPVQVPSPVVQTPNFLARLFTWLASLFGA